MTLSADDTDPGAQLARIHTAAARMAAASPAAAPAQRRYLALLGVALGLLAGAVALTAHRSPAGLVLSLSGFLILVQFAVAYRQATRTVTPRGSGRRSAWAGGITAALYAAAVLWATLRQTPLSIGPALAVAVVVAAPAVFMAVVAPARS